MTEQILAMTRYAKVQSVFESRYYRVNFDPHQRIYWVSSRRESQYERLDNNFGNLYSIPVEIDPVVLIFAGREGVFLDVLLTPVRPQRVLHVWWVVGDEDAAFQVRGISIRNRGHRETR